MNGDMWRNKLIEGLKKTVYIKPEDYEVQNLVLIHMLHLTMCLILIATIFNPFVGVSKSVIFSNNLSAFIIGCIYWAVRFKKRYTLGRRLYLLFVFVMINYLWIETGGSTGPTVVYIVAFVPMLTFMVSSKMLKYTYTIIFFNIPMLLLFEVYFPEYITSYPSQLHRVMDILMVFSVFIVFEIPLIIYVKKVVIEQRNTARQSEKLKTSFITSLSHEIRTPMNAILGFSELLNQDDLENDERKSYINHINENGNTLLLLLNNIINISKIEQEQTKVSLSKFVGLQIVQRVYSSLSYKQSDAVDFRIVATEADNDMIYSDAAMLFQILTNLTFNALKFTKEGFVHLDIQTHGHWITFIVKDSGIGICQSKQDKLFKQYEQAKDDNQLMNLDGSGLGLAICSNLTEKLNGQLYFESEKNVGTTFYLKLPTNNQ